MKNRKKTWIKSENCIKTKEMKRGVQNEEMKTPEDEKGCGGRFKVSRGAFFA